MAKSGDETGSWNKTRAIKDNNLPTKFEAQTQDASRLGGFGWDWGSFEEKDGLGWDSVSFEEEGQPKPKFKAVIGLDVDQHQASPVLWRSLVSLL